VTPTMVWAEPSKQPVPTEAQQADSLNLIRDVYKEDYAKAKTVAQKVDLAQKLLRDGVHTTNNPSGKFVMLRVARDVASQAGDMTTALKAVSEIDRSYQIDVLEMKAGVLSKVAKSATVSTEHKGIVEPTLAFVTEALSADRYEIAQHLAEIAVASSRSAKD